MLNEMLKQLRKENGKTQSQIAEHLEIAQSSYNQYEKGTAQPNAGNIVKIANYFNVTTDYLLENKEVCKIEPHSNSEIELIRLFKNLNEVNKLKAISYLSGLYVGQN